MSKSNHRIRDRSQSRRCFLAWTGATAASISWSASRRASASVAEGVAREPRKAGRLKLGLASYTARKLSLDKALTLATRLDLKYICLKSVHLPLDAKPEEIAAITAKVRQAGLTLYGGGVIVMQKESQIAGAFEYAKTAGMELIVAAPSADMLPLIEAKAKEYDIAVAIHNHGPGDKHFPTPASVYEKVKNLDRRVGLCIDIGHTVRIGADLIRSTK